MTEKKSKDPFLNYSKTPEFKENESAEQPKQGYRVDNRVKKGSRISIKTFVIGCVIFGLFLFFIIYAGLYYIISRPTTLSSFGMEAETIKNLLKIFVFLFFGLLFFVGFVILGVNVYRLTTSKGEKLKNGLGTALGVVLLMFSIGFGIFSIIKINQISTNQKPQTDKLILKYREAKDKKFWTGEPGLKIIAPAVISLELNKDVFTSEVINKYGLDAIESMEVDCGTGGQIIKGDAKTLMSKEDAVFDQYCLYMKKGEYNVKFTYTYKDKDTGKTKSEEKVMDPIDIATQIDLSVNGGDYKINNGQILVGDVPAKVFFDPKDIFSDLFITEQSVEWDFGDGKTIPSKGKRISTIFDKAGTYEVYYRLPTYAGYEDQLFGFIITAGAADENDCAVNLTKYSGNKYTISMGFGNGEDVPISDYKYIIRNSDSGRTLHSETINSEKYQYDFPSGARYEVEIDYKTKDGKKGVCKSEILDLSKGDYDAMYSVKVQGGSDGSFGDAQISGNTLKINVIPSTVRFSIDKIIPSDADIKLSMEIDGKSLSMVEKNVFEAIIDSSDYKTAKIIMTDDTGKKSEKIINLDVNEKPLRAKLKAKETSGTDPFEVTLDASSSELTDIKDEIIYFSWDFGDGQTMNNVSAGKVKHTYFYDKSKNDGEYHPKVTVKTKNGVTDEASLSVPIIVKKAVKDFNIMCTSHPTQVANVGDSLTFEIETDGDITEVIWDFGNGKKRTFEGREGTQVNVTYDESGNYKVTATVRYSDFPEVSRNINVRIK